MSNGSKRLVVIGEVVWDVYHDSERLGGAPLNFAIHAKRLGHHPALISAVGDDERGRIALERIRELELDMTYLDVTSDYPTGTVKVDLEDAGQPSYRLQRPAAFDASCLSPDRLNTLTDFGASWVYFGTLQNLFTKPKATTLRILRNLPNARKFYDVNLRQDSYSPELLNELLPLADVVKLNEEEMDELEQLCGHKCGGLEAFCREYSRRYGWLAICVTRAERGCALLVGECYVEVEGFRVEVADTVGAGDAFAAAVVHGLSNNWSACEIGAFGNRLGAIVASRRGGAPDWNISELWEL
jgi:fructokinase